MNGIAVCSGNTQSRGVRAKLAKSMLRASAVVATSFAASLAHAATTTSSNPSAGAPAAPAPARSGSAVPGKGKVASQASYAVLPEITVERERQTALAVQSMSISDTPDAGPLSRHFEAIVGLGALDSPVYPGSDKMKVSPYPYVDIQGLLGGRVYLSDLNGIGVYAVDSGPFRAGFGVNRSSSRTSSDDVHLKGLPDIGTTGEVKGFVAYTFGPFALEASVGRRLGANPGTQAQIAFGASAAPAPALHLTATLSIGWADASYQQLFFGITPQESVQATQAGNPLPAYVAKAGLTSANLVFGAVYQFGDHWGVVARAGISDLVGSSAKDSPLTRNSLGKSVAFGVAYMF
jgi:outer membrane protein